MTQETAQRGMNQEEPAWIAVQIKEVAAMKLNKNAESAISGQRKS